MKNLKIEIVTKACEKLVLRISAEHEDGTKSFKHIDCSGNLGSAPFAYGLKFVDGFNELEAEFQAKPGDPDYSEPCSECGR